MRFRKCTSSSDAYIWSSASLHSLTPTYIRLKNTRFRKCTSSSDAYIWSSLSLSPSLCYSFSLLVPLSTLLSILYFSLLLSLSVSLSLSHIMKLSATHKLCSVNLYLPQTKTIVSLLYCSKTPHAHATSTLHFVKEGDKFWLFSSRDTHSAPSHASKHFDR